MKGERFPAEAQTQMARERGKRQPKYIGVLPKAEQRAGLHTRMALPEMGTGEGQLKCEVQGLLSQLQPSLYPTSVSTWALRGPT